jgi:molybdenum cofactor cytidylyltransferase
VAAVNARRIAAVILAAGGSSRMGRPKQLLEIGGVTLIQRVTRAALEGGCDPVLVISGAGHEVLSGELISMPVELVHNADWAKGIGSSIRAGFSELQRRPGVDGAIILLCDQPSIGAEVILRLRQAWLAAGTPMAACTYAGTLGPPCGFARQMFADLINLGDSDGAKKLLIADPKKVTQIAWPDGTIDLDTESDVRAYKASETTRRNK